MGHHDFLIKLAEANLIESSLHSLNNHWEILSPLDLVLSFGCVGEVDVEKSIVFEGVVGIERFPNLVIVRPPLQKYDNIFASAFAFKEILQRFHLRHIKRCYKKYHLS